MGWIMCKVLSCLHIKNDARRSNDKMFCLMVILRSVLLPASLHGFVLLRNP